VASITDESGQVLSKPKRNNAPTLRLKKGLLSRSVTLTLATARYNQLKVRASEGLVFLLLLSLVDLSVHTGMPRTDRVG
jgi:hypothetical protein